MRTVMKVARNCAGAMLVETLCAAVLGSVVLAGGITGVIALQKSAMGARQYSAGLNDGTRLADHISRDLRNAVRISRLASGTPAVFKTGFMTISDSDQFVVFVPDYYRSNVPDNTSSSTFKQPRLSRTNLPAGTTAFPYTDTVVVVGTLRVPKYPGEVEIRYRKAPRSASDPTVCYFREEYDGGSTPVLRSREEIAQQSDAVRVSVTALAPTRFRVISSFSPKWSGEPRRAGTLQASVVRLLNSRRD